MSNLTAFLWSFFKSAQLRKTNFLIPAALAFIFVTWRFAVFMFVHPAYFREQDSIFLLGSIAEELLRGAVAKELMSNGTIPIWDYRPDNYAGGSYVIITLFTFFFKVFGFKILAIKTVGILCTVGVLWFWYKILAEFAGRRTALFFAALYTFAPFRYITHSTLSLGDHAETCLLSALTIFLFFRLFQIAPQHRAPSYAVLGLLAGFSLWFAYIYGLTLVSLLVFLILSGRIQPLNSKNMLLAGVGFAVGFSFWILFNIREEFSGFVIHGSPIWELFKIGKLLEPIHSLRSLFLVKIFQLIQSHDLHDTSQNIAFFSYAFFCLTLAMTAPLVNKSRPEILAFFKTPAGLSWIYIVIFCIIQQMYFTIGIRFLVPLFPFILVLIAEFLSKISRSKPWLAGLLAGIFILAGIFSCTSRFSDFLKGEYLSRKSYSLQSLGLLPNLKISEIENVISGRFSQLSEPDKMDYIQAYARSIELGNLKTPLEIQRAVYLIPGEYRGFFAYLVGRELTLQFKNPASPIDIAQSFKENSPLLSEQLISGIFDGILLLGLNPQELRTLKLKIPASYADYTARLEGFAFADEALDKDYHFDRFKEKFLRQAENLAGDARKKFTEGSGSFLFKLWSRDPLHSIVLPRDFENFPDEYRRDLLAGAAASSLRRHIFYASSPILWQFSEFEAHLSPEGKRQFQKEFCTQLARTRLSQKAIPVRLSCG